MTIRKFNINSYMMGRIRFQMGELATNGAITFKKGRTRYTHIAVVNEDMVDTMNLKYLYAKLLPDSREIKGDDAI